MTTHTMKSGRKLVSVFDEPKQQEATASDKHEATAGMLENARDGYCPKCGAAMGYGHTPVGTLYYCTSCRVSAPIPKAD